MTHYEPPSMPSSHGDATEGQEGTRVTPVGFAALTEALERSERARRGQQVEIREQARIIDAVRALVDAEEARVRAVNHRLEAEAVMNDKTGPYRVVGILPAHKIRAILDPAPETPADCCVRQMADPMWCHPHEAKVAQVCGCPTNEAGDIRCHKCGERVNKRCWNCKTPRGEGKCPNPKTKATP